MKEIKFTESDIKLANLLKAMGNPVRLSILRTLLEKSSCPHGSHPCTCGDKCDGENCKCGCKCGELVELLPMSQSTVSQHIKELTKVGLIKTSGRKGDYTLNHERLKEGILSLLDLLGFQKEIYPEKTCCNCY